MMDWYRANHAWFAAYAPAKAPEIAIAVLVEHGGAGPTIAAPIAIQIVRDYERLKAVRAGKPPPPAKPAHNVTGHPAALPTPARQAPVPSVGPP